VGLQKRVERSGWGRALISALIVVTLAFAVVENMPQSRLRREVLKLGQPYLNAIGLDQRWALFAPEPRRRSIALRALVQYADGTAETWRVPHGGALIGGYWDYHWQKWVEWVLDAGHGQLWRPAALFIARDMRRPDRRVVRVTLIRLTSLNNPPGVRPDHQPIVAVPYYTLSITPAMLGGGTGR
jgi:hypothetical protein